MFVPVSCMYYVLLLLCTVVPAFVAVCVCVRACVWKVADQR